MSKKSIYKNDNYGRLLAYLYSNHTRVFYLHDIEKYVTSNTNWSNVMKKSLEKEGIILCSHKKVFRNRKNQFLKTNFEIIIYKKFLNYLKKDIIKDIERKINARYIEINREVKTRYKKEQSVYCRKRSHAGSLRNIHNASVLSALISDLISPYIQYKQTRKSFMGSAIDSTMEWFSTLPKDFLDKKYLKKKKIINTYIKSPSDALIIIKKLNDRTLFEYWISILETEAPADNFGFFIQQFKANISNTLKTGLKFSLYDIFQNLVVEFGEQYPKILKNKTKIIPNNIESGLHAIFLICWISNNLPGYISTK